MQVDEGLISWRILGYINASSWIRKLGFLLSINNIQIDLEYFLEVFIIKLDYWINLNIHNLWHHLAFDHSTPSTNDNIMHIEHRVYFWLNVFSDDASQIVNGQDKFNINFGRSFLWWNKCSTAGGFFLYLE